jgi:hypothetical protein
MHRRRNDAGTMNRYRLPLLLVPLLSLGCHTETPLPQSPATEPMIAMPAGQSRFEDKATGISFEYPAGWAETSKDSVQFKFASRTPADPAIELVLDIPKLPWHIPGMIPIDSVRDGYVDDVKKRMPDAQVNNLMDPSIPDARQHRVMLTGQIDNRPVVNDAVTIVHGDHVFILSVEVDPAIYPRAKAVLDHAVATLNWSK